MANTDNRPSVNRGNLVGKTGKDAPYIHSRAATFNMAAGSMNVGEFRRDGSHEGRTIEDAIDHLNKQKEERLRRETLFYQKYGVAGAKEWGDKYLARTGKDASIPQIALAVWNSHELLEKLIGERTIEQIKEDLNPFIFKYIESKGVKALFAHELNEIIKKSKTNVDFSKAVAKLIESTSDAATQIELRQVIKPLKDGVEETRKIVNKKMRDDKKWWDNLTSRIAYKEVREFTRTGDKKVRQDNAIDYFSRTFKAEVERYHNINIEGEKRDVYLYLLNFFTEQIKAATTSKYKLQRDLLSGSDGVIIGANAEIGDPQITSTIVAMNMGFNFKIEKNNPDIDRIKSFHRRVGQMPVSRFGRKGEKQGKTDTFIDTESFTSSKEDLIVDPETGFRIQNKNTNKDIFLGLEAMESLKTDPFFNIHSKIAYLTFLDDIHKIKGITPDENLLASLSYLLANVNALNDSYSKGLEKRDRAYKQWTSSGSAPGQLVQYAETIISRIISSYIIFALADFIKETTEGSNIYEALPYDFIIFDSRVLIPVSEIYEGIIKNIQQTTEEINTQSARLTVRSGLKGGKIDMRQLYKDKKSIPGGLKTDLKPWYQDSSLTSIGKATGQTVIDNLVLTGMQLDINVDNLVDLSLNKL